MSSLHPPPPNTVRKMSVLNEAIARYLAETTSVPVVFRGYLNNGPLCQWTAEKWAEVFGEREFPFRCVSKGFQSDEPCWEVKSTIKKITFKKFAELAMFSDETMYFDYKYLHEWFSEDDELNKEMSWNQFGFYDKGPTDTTLWVGSAGAHTPAHQDTYGVNIVTQVYGKKRWVLFPPESGCLKPTRVPYEESSVYSELNFFCPVDVQVFKKLTGARVVDLSAGDALVVPHKWWHYVQNENPINISLNMWLPHEEDDSSRMSEAAIKIFVAHICKDLPKETVKRILNPNEMDLIETPQSELLLLFKAAADQCLDNEQKKLANKRRKTDEEHSSVSDIVHIDYDIKALLDNPSNNLVIPPIITGQELVKLVEETKNRYKMATRSPRDHEADDSDQLFRLTKNIINEFCQGDVVDKVRRKFS